jgi:hypothetical protein
MKIKKIVLGLSIVILGVASCKKKYTCTCTYDANGTISNTSEYKLTEEDAKSSCNSADNAEGITCELTK